MPALGVVVNYVSLGLLIYTLYGVIYRLYLSPVAKFPGRKLAALTFWYEFYYDSVKSGSYVWEIEKMHREYGPIVRINPYELHVLNPSTKFLTELYPSTGKNIDKWWWSARMFGSTDMTFGTAPSILHRKRRAAFSQFFSKSSIRRLESILQGLVDTLCRHIDTDLDAGKQVNLVHAYSALTQDIITEYCFADCRHVLEMEDFSPHYYYFLQDPCKLTPVMKQLPYLIPFLNLLPDWFIKIAHPPTAYFREQLAGYATMVQRVLTGGSNDTASHLTIFHALRDDPSLPYEEKTLPRLTAEATSLVGAGTLTSAHMLAITTYHILANDKILSRLLTELEAVIPDSFSPPDLLKLEQLPYLSGVINEGLRLSYGVLHRLTRVHTDRALQFGDWTIPPNTPVGTSPVFMHDDEAVFPHHKVFDPDRWVKADKDQREAMTKRISNFGHGSRQCVGMNLAYAEFYLTISAVVRRLGRKMELFDTERKRDVDLVRDYFIPAPSEDSRGVRVGLKG